MTGSVVAVPEVSPILAIRDMVVYPGVVVPITIGREKSLRLSREAMEGDQLLTVVTQKDMDLEEVGPDDLYGVGTLVKLHHLLQLPNDTIKIMVQGMERVRVGEYVSTEPYLKAHVTAWPDASEESDEARALMAAINQQLLRYGEMIQGFPEELATIALNLEDPVKLAYLVGFNLPLKLSERQAVLEADGGMAKLREISRILGSEIQIQELGQKLQTDVQTSLGKTQKDFFLREQIKAIQKELGEGDEREAEVSELREKLAEAAPPPEALKEAERELGRLERLPPGSAEHSVIRTYLDWIVDLPWNRSTPDNLDIARAREILDEDHYDLTKIKQRILEYLAVYKLKHDRLGESSLKGPILCLVGPPGVGKTSLGQSIARALGRKFVRMSLGGMRDESEIRGHRRTYIGAMPGRILQAIKRSGSNNPVFMLDEIDKLGADLLRGDPASALLEVLDPAQNLDFRDHYLDLPFDLSKVLFIATANVLDPILPALRDRMEILQLSGYTHAEKREIARRYLIPKQVEEHGLHAREFDLSDEALDMLIAEYTREAGVRNLEREIASLCRKAATQLTTGEVESLSITPSNLRDLLGKPRHYPEAAEMLDRPGISTGLAWTETGGDILFIEVTRLPGKGRLKITGQLGDVMKESAQAALSYLASRAGELGLDETHFCEYDYHLHVPAGAIPKDGPSAGIAITAAIASLVSGRQVRPSIAMTGEVTLRGKVLPVGGIKEKVLAARRAGISTVILPRRNEADLEDIPDEILRTMQIILVDGIDEALSHALTPLARVVEAPAQSPVNLDGPRTGC
ncbi:Lon protease 2 [compost metagenome]